MEEEEDAEEETNCKNGEMQVTFSTMEETVERITPFPDCYKPNGSVHSGKTNAQTRVRLLGYSKAIFDNIFKFK